MKPNVIATAVATLLLAGMLAATTMRQQQLVTLRKEARAAQTAPPPTTEESVPGVRSDAAAADHSPAAPLTAAELAELLTLRGEVAGLRRVKPQFTAIRAENERLRTALAKADQPGADGTPSPDAYLAASQARFAGYTTPRDTLRSFLWAVRSRDTNALFQVLTPDSVTKITAEMERQNPGREILAGLSKIPGFRVKTLTEKPDGTAEAEVQFDPDSENDAKAERLPLERINGEWKLKLP